MIALDYIVKKYYYLDIFKQNAFFDYINKNPKTYA